jgi:hypothetical protein
MRDVIEEGQGRRGKLIRLTGVASNLASLSLYLSMGFRLVEPLIAFGGSIQEAREGETGEDARVHVEPMRLEDIEACDELHKQVTGVSRKTNILQGMTGYAEENSVPPLVAWGVNDGKVCFLSLFPPLHHLLSYFPLAIYLSVETDPSLERITRIHHWTLY